MRLYPISVIVCTHNRAELLPRVLGQLRAQDYPAEAFEILVVDNGSTDQTPEVVQRLSAEPGIPIRYLVENRPGVTFARNRGAELARYPYLAYLDDDCSLEPNWLQQLISGFDLDEKVAIVGGQVQLDLDGKPRPAWLGPQSERWLATYNHPGEHPRLLSASGYLIEGNLAITRAAWEMSGGFLGMDQFGSPHMAAEEIIYLLKQIERRGGRIAFVPGALVHHHPGLRPWQWFLKRAYWHGVSDGILDYLLSPRSWLRVGLQTLLDLLAMLAFLGFSGFSLLTFNLASAMYQLLRATARFGKILSQARFAGDWPRVHAWAASHPDRFKNEATL